MSDMVNLKILLMKAIDLENTALDMPYISKNTEIAISDARSKLQDELKNLWIDRESAKMATILGYFPPEDREAQIIQDGIEAEEWKKYLEDWKHA